MSQVLYSLELNGEPGKGQAHGWSPLCVHEIDGVIYSNWMPRADFVKDCVDQNMTVKICDLTFMGLKEKHKEGEAEATLMTITPLTGMVVVEQP